jgi:hypothetical protein
MTNGTSQLEQARHSAEMANLRFKVLQKQEDERIAAKKAERKRLADVEYQAKQEAKRIAEEDQFKARFVGKKVISVTWHPEDTGYLMFIFEDQGTIQFSASGDECAYISISVTPELPPIALVPR